MSENENLEYQDITFDNLCDLEMASMALNELLNEYDWAYEPDAIKAIEHGSTAGGSKDKAAQFSYKYIADYRKIMWLVKVARDYCLLALERCENVCNGGVSNE